MFKAKAGRTKTGLFKKGHYQSCTGGAMTKAKSKAQKKKSPGLTAAGKLKQGYKFAKGGRVVKVKR